MNNDKSLPLELWRQIFISVCQQVERAEIDSSADLLNIMINGRSEALQATSRELDNDLRKFNNNVREVVFAFMKKHGVLIVYQNTLVGFFDIQAYSAFIEGTDFKDGIWKINNLFSILRSAAKTDMFDVKLDCWILSDSIIVVIDTDRSPLFSGSLECFLGTCSMLMSDAMRQGFPLRGAIGGGDFFKDGELMVSPALVDAARYEKEQEWLGAVLTPKARDLIEKAKDFEKQVKGKTDIDFTSDKFKPYIRYGAFYWKESTHNVLRSPEGYYIKPYHMADKNWATKYIPPYFKGQLDKIKNSRCLYAEE